MSASVHRGIPGDVTHRAFCLFAPINRQAQSDDMDRHDKPPTELPTGFVTVGQALALALDQLQKQWAEEREAQSDRA